jgi:hypothetical protein
LPGNDALENEDKKMAAGNPGMEVLNQAKIDEQIIVERYKTSVQMSIEQYRSLRDTGISFGADERLGIVRYGIASGRTISIAIKGLCTSVRTIQI